MKTRAIAVVVSSGLALAFSLATAPVSAQLAPRGERARAIEIRPNRYLLGAGTGILVAAYAPGVVVAATNDNKADDWLYLPVLGTWIDLGERDPCRVDCSNDDLFKLLMVTAGSAQVIGALTIITAFFVPEYRSPPLETQSKSEIRISPMQLTKTGYGFGVTGQF